MKIAIEVASNGYHQTFVSDDLDATPREWRQLKADYRKKLLHKYRERHHATMVFPVKGEDHIFNIRDIVVMRFMDDP